LKQMVRNIMGCLVAVGRGKVTPADVRCILEKRDRSIAPATALARGLCMERVFYPEDMENARSAVAVSKDAAHDEHQVAGGSGASRPDPDQRD